MSEFYYDGKSILTPLSDDYRQKALSVLPRVLVENAKHKNMAGDVLFMATGAGHFQREGKSFNRITDYLIQESPADTVTVEGLVDWQIPIPRWNKRTQYWLPWLGGIVIGGRLRQRPNHKHLAQEMLQFISQRAQLLFGLRMPDDQIQFLISMTSRKIARLPVMRYVYRRLLSKVNPRLVLVEQSCYSDLGVFNHVARDMGIRVAEPQHGMVSGGHDAYNYAPVLYESTEFRNYLPHDFLGYGRWWHDQINVPVQKWVIGHPHYTEQWKGKDRNESSKKKKDILLLSDGFEFSKYLKLAQELAESLQYRFRVVLRPHPEEREQVYTEYPEGTKGDVVIDQNRDIYQSLSTAYVVSGEVSTGLFEAIGRVEKVFLWETSKASFRYPHHPFEGFSNAKSFAAKILDNHSDSSSVILEDFWATDWRENYRNYLKHVLQGKRI